jgi:hypothetical protein
LIQTFCRPLKAIRSGAASGDRLLRFLHTVSRKLRIGL